MADFKRFYDFLRFVTHNQLKSDFIDLTLEISQPSLNLVALPSYTQVVTPLNFQVLFTWKFFWPACLGYINIFYLLRQLYLGRCSVGYSLNSMSKQHIDCTRLQAGNVLLIMSRNYPKLRYITKYSSGNFLIYIDVKIYPSALSILALRGQQGWWTKYITRSYFFYSVQCHNCKRSWRRPKLGGVHYGKFQWFIKSPPKKISRDYFLDKGH